MKNLSLISLIVFAAVVGGIVGSLFSGFIIRAKDTATGIRTKEVILVDENNSPAARLGFVDGGPVLQFYNKDSTVALQVGVDRSRKFKFLHFFGENNRILAALNSLENGDTTLYLGDRGWEGRVILGAIESDIPTNEPSDSWGLVFRNRSTSPLFSVMIGNVPTPSAQIRLVRANG